MTTEMDDHLCILYLKTMHNGQALTPAKSHMAEITFSIFLLKNKPVNDVTVLFLSRLQGHSGVPFSITGYLIPAINDITESGNYSVAMKP